MQKLLLIACLVWLSACTKSGNDYSNSLPSQRPFFKNGNEAFTLVKSQVSRFHKDENLKTIDSISYMYSPNRSYAFVFYTSSKGTSNMVIQKSYVQDVAQDVTVTKCSGPSCNCQVMAIISNSGNVDVSCSCSSCTMTINNALQ